jgi:ribosomal protein S18 acetylase RimI-like enzyme
MEVRIATATAVEYDQLVQLDRHVTPGVITQKIIRGEILVACTGSAVIGWLRYGYFWDSIPFMNMLAVQQPYRGRGIGAQLVTAWEQAMRAQGYTEVLTSTLANEQAQFFYRQLGYQDCGALLLPSEPMEILMRKVL